MCNGDRLCEILTALFVSRFEMQKEAGQTKMSYSKCTLTNCIIAGLKQVPNLKVEEGPLVIHLTWEN